MLTSLLHAQTLRNMARDEISERIYFAPQQQPKLNEWRACTELDKKTFSHEELIFTSNFTWQE
jgi:hypothetical protein